MRIALRDINKKGVEMGECPNRGMTKIHIGDIRRIGDYRF